MQVEISYLNIISAACATAAFMIAGMHFVLWIRSTRKNAYLLSTIMSVAAGALAITELHQSLSPDIETYVALSQLTHVVLFVLLVSLVSFVSSYLGTGPRWMIFVIASLWLVSVVQSFVLPFGVVHAEIIELAEGQTIWGETFAVARGPINPGKYIADLAVILILVFLLLAGWQAAQRGQQKRAMLVTVSAVSFLLISVVSANLEDLGLAAFPFTAPLSFLIVIALLTYMILDDAFRANDAAMEVQQMRRILTLGEMVGGLAHEINQPLAAILSNAQAARRFLASPEIDMDEIREIIDDIIDDDKRAGEIVQGLRQMLRRDLPDGNVADANTSLETATMLVKGEFHAKDVALVTKVAPDLGQVQLNSVELEQVLVNLMLNAVRAASGAGRKDRWVKVSCTASDGAAKFSISDSGEGIDPEVFDKLFEPFVSSYKDGLGLGLAICKRIVERSGGEIWASRREGDGAEFIFTVPFADPSKSA
jgi:signal transduction histidine kinase